MDFNRDGLPAGAHAADGPQSVRIGYPSSAVSTLPFDIAKEKGFYAKAGLDVEYIQMRTVIAPQAVLNGNINFFTSPQSAISAAVSGLPLVVVLSLYKDTPWVLVTGKDIYRAPGLDRQENRHLGHPILALSISRARDLKNSDWTTNKSAWPPPEEPPIALPL